MIILKVLQKLPTNDSHIKLMKMLNDDRPRAEILKELPDLNWVMMDSNVYDLGDFFHPGGDFILDA